MEDLQKWRLESETNHNVFGWNLQPSARDLTQEVSHYITKSLSISGNPVYATMIRGLELSTCPNYRDPLSRNSIIQIIVYAKYDKQVWKCWYCSSTHDDSALLECPNCGGPRIFWGV
jgi:hypothetical protein